MTYVKYDLNQELRKFAWGRKTKEDIGVLIHQALDHNPDAQAAAAKLFGIREYERGTKKCRQQ
jgi:hypothetical protein